MQKPPIKFHDVAEIIFAIFMIEGFIKAGESFEWRRWMLEQKFDCPVLQILACGIISGLVLIRFFFAPYKNLKRIINFGPEFKANGAKQFYSLVLLIDVPILLFHAVLFYEMGTNIDDARFFILFFYLLLLMNVIWLKWIQKRLFDLKAPNIEAYDQWIKNNWLCIKLGIAVCVIYIAFLFVYPGINTEFYCKVGFILIAFYNCCRDLLRTQFEYLTD